MKGFTEQEVQAALDVIAAVGLCIKELGSVPAGHLYARMMGHMSLEQFNTCIDRLVSSGLVKRETSHLLTWTGGR